MHHLLIIEDEAVIRSALRRLLERHGYQVTEAESVEDAQANGGFDAYSLIITDLRLPGRSGSSVLELAASVPVIIMTSYATVTSAVDAMKSGAADYIAKPFDHLVVVERFGNVISSATFHRVDGRGHGGVAGHDDHRHPGCEFEYRTARTSRQSQIGDDHVLVTETTLLLCRLDRLGLADVMAMAFEQATQRTADDRLVFNDEQLIHRIAQIPATAD